LTKLGSVAIRKMLLVWRGMINVLYSTLADM
jgi:hypothetical protein